MELRSGSLLQDLDDAESEELESDQYRPTAEFGRFSDELSDYFERKTRLGCDGFQRTSLAVDGITGIFVGGTIPTVVGYSHLQPDGRAHCPHRHEHIDAPRFRQLYDAVDTLS